MDVPVRPNRVPRSAFALALTLALALTAIAIRATPAGAVIEQVKDGTETVEVGVVPRQPVPVNKPADTLQYHGGSVDPATYVYAIYWDPVQAYRSDWMRIIDGYLHEVGVASGQLGTVFALNAQYRDAQRERAGYHVTFRGAYTDTTAYPKNGCTEANVEPTCLTDGQIRAELQRFVASEHLPTGREIVYYVLTPPAVTVCLDEGGSGDCSTSNKELEEEATPGGEVNEPGLPEEATGFCGYHSVIEPGGETPIVYAVQPWVAGHAGGVIKQLPQLVSKVATGAAMACQNGAVLVEPNQAPNPGNLDSYETGLADVIVNDLSLQQNDIMDDPLVSGGWYQNGSKAEQSDMCRGAFSPIPLQAKEEKLEGTEALKASNATLGGHSYYLQYGYSSVGVTSGHGATCWSGVELSPHFTATNVVKGGDIVAFDALESSMTLDANLTNLGQYELEPEAFTAPIYKWQFGDGTSTVSTQASVFHTYQYAGNYEVTLTVTDSGGYEGNFTNTVPVGSPPPPPPPPASLPAGSGPSTSGGSGGVGSTTPPPPTAGSAGVPAITENVLSSSLKKAVSLGLAIRYDVNEQVAGRAEALLEKSLASRLHLKGPLAAGLPKGYPREIVIGTKVLVTTRAGHGIVRIKFSKSVAKRLAKAHQVKLTLRFVLRSPSGGATHTSTALSTVLLRH